MIRWRMLRQVQRRRGRWLEAQSRTYRHIHYARYLQQKHQRRALLYAVAYEW